MEAHNDTLDSQIHNIENDPLNLHGDSSFEEEEMQNFIDSHKTDKVKMHVVFYMISCLKYLGENAKAQEIGFEIAELGRTGIHPSSNDTYNLSSVRGITFTGWKLLAWMYVCWMDFKPELVSSFQLDFEDEYEMAKKLI